MTAQMIIGDGELAIRRWLASVPAITDITGGTDHVVMALPPKPSFSKGGNATPYLVINRIGGAPRRSGAPVDDCLVQFSIWADKANKAAAANLAAAVVQVVMGLSSVQVQMPDGVVCKIGYSQVTENVWSPDTSSSENARYLVTATLPVMTIVNV